ncbi:MAG: sulfatase, partial [Gemmatimonas sp.]
MRWRLTGLVAGIVVLAGFEGLPPNERVSALPPNVLFVLTDDLDAASLAHMPNVNALLAEQGVSFANYFVSVSLCCPSRATMMRGQYSHNTGVRTNGGGNGGFETAYAKGIEQSTIATWLQTAGYRTAFYGKYLNGYPRTAPDHYVPPGWTDWASAVLGNAYSEYNYTLNENGRSVRYGSAASDYGTDVYARKAAAFMRRTATEQAPFFIYLSVYAPHGPATPAPRHAELFAGASAPRTPSFDEADVSDKPRFVRNRPRIGGRVQASIDTLYRKRLQSLQAVDEAVASLIDTLRATGQLANTFVVFTSDNGFHQGQHRLVTGKQTAYDEDIRVPLIVRGPGVPSGHVVQHLVGNVDLAPTFAEFGKAVTPSFVDGRSLVPLL